jgi:putative ABC transport system permease protein
MFKSYLKVAWRGLQKDFAANLTKIGGLAIGMTAAILILLWVQSELTYDSYHENANRIYRVTYDFKSNNGDQISEYSPYLLAPAAKKEIPEVESATRFFTSPWETPIFNIRGELYNEKSYGYVDENWFTIFHYEFVDGNSINFAKNPFSLILTESKAKSYFGKSSPIGQFIKIDSTNYEVQGVIKDNPNNSSFQFDVLLPLSAYLSRAVNRQVEESWNSANYITFLKLAGADDKKKTEFALNRILNSAVTAGKSSAELLSLKDMHFEKGSAFSSIAHGDSKTIYILESLVFLLLFVASINYVNLTMARSGRHAKDVSIRKIVGARFRELFLKFMIEAALMSFIALLCTFILIKLVLPLFNTVSGKHFALDLLSTDLWRVAGAVFLFALLLNSVYPAILLSSFNPLLVFRGISILKIKDSYFRKSLLVLQFIISISLIIGSIVMIDQIKYVRNLTDFQAGNKVFSVSSPVKLYLINGREKNANLLALYKQELLAESSIEDVSMGGSSAINIQGSRKGEVEWEGRPKDFAPEVAALNADPEYIHLFGLRMTAGRWFRASDGSNSHYFILNETAVEEFNIHPPVVGKRFILSRDTGEILGIVKDFHFKNLHEKIAPLVIFNTPSGQFHLFVNPSSNNAGQAIRTARALWEKLVPAFPFDYSFLDIEFDNLYKAENRILALVVSFSIISICIAILGLLGLVSLATEQRAKEICIRKVVGASAVDIIRLISKNYLALVLLAILIASPISWWAMGFWLDDFAYRINLSWYIFTAAGLSVLSIVILTVGFVALNAYFRNTAASLRPE